MEKWELSNNSGYGPKVIAVRRQFPLDLAWALTIHKSQGMSLDCVQVDLTKCFAPGISPLSRYGIWEAVPTDDAPYRPAYRSQVQKYLSLSIPYITTARMSTGNLSPKLL